MGTKVSGGRGRVLIAAGALLCTLVLTLLSNQRPAQAGVPIAPLSELRIEGPTANIEPGTWYVTPPEEIKRSRGNSCTRRSGTRAVPPSALSITDSASDATDALPAVRVRPDDFGLFVCEIGGRVGRPFDHPNGFSGWTYWVDFTGGTQAAENVPLPGGQRVLWVFSDFGDADRNTGDALELSDVPPYDADGTFVVEVTEHAFGGAPAPMDDAVIKGADSFDPLGDGLYEVTVPQGRTELWAKHKPDIASNRLSTCRRASAASCPTAHGRRIVGSADAEGIQGTAGWDSIRARGGNDVITIEQGGRDTVDCGGGDDLVGVPAGDGDDRIDANCEEIAEPE